MDEGTVRTEAARADLSLIEGYLAGREEDFREVERWLLQVVDSRYQGLRDEREDLCQEVHEKLLTNLRAGRFRQDSSFRTYVTSVVHHTCIDALRKKYLHRTDHPTDDVATERGNPYLILERLELRQILHRVLLLSPEICRRLWRMIFLERLHYGEIGQRLGIPAGTVKSRMFACRQKALAIFKKLNRSAPA